ncbi:MAG: hypothetical protein H8D80_01945 [Proteobacteria bacterium]|nr:hypothetical protein [Pseudomonadota bacterium]
MESKDIIDALLAEKLVSVKENTESVLYSKLAHKLQEKYEEFAPPVFEGKKLDPVDKDELKGKHKDREDKDIDNDGDSDDSDKFLHKKRKAISKAIKADESVSEDDDCDDCDEDKKVSKGLRKSFGMRTTSYENLPKDRQTKAKSSYYDKKKQEVLFKDKERKVKEREDEKKKEVDESSSERKAELIKRGRAGHKPGVGDKEKGSYSKGGAIANDRRARTFNRGREDRLKAKERKLKAIADKRKSLSREKETAERDAV